MTCSATIATLRYSSDAKEAAIVKTPAELVRERPGWNDPFRVTVTPEIARGIAVRSDGGGDGTLVPIEESTRFVLFVPSSVTLPTTRTEIVVHADSHGLIGDRFWDVSRDDLVVFVASDPRLEAEREARPAKITAICGGIVAFLFLPIGILLTRKSRRDALRKS